MSSIPSVPESRVLSTMQQDGSRRWLHPRVARGKFYTARRGLAYLLIAIFTLLPWIRIHGKPSILLDLPRREFTLFGFTFLPTDTLLLALLLVTLIVGICLVTALVGRVWCGWMCPQTVYMEFVYRPIERLFDGPPGAKHRAGNRATPIRTILKFVVYLAISAFLAHTFLAYFVGVDALREWIKGFRSPLEHPVSFLIMAGVTGAMMFDFGYFREQMCIVACPYGRFQAVMLDRNSLIVSYDRTRGEPRGKIRKGGGTVPIFVVGTDRRLVDHKNGTVPFGPTENMESTTAPGDCLDCGACTDTCPTGIDIREGLQLECIACTQCIDACNQVMQRVGRPRDLIRYSSQARAAGAPGRLLRARIVVYPAIMLVLVGAFAYVLAGKQTAEATLLRGLGAPFNELEPGRITNTFRVKIKNRGDAPATYRIEAEGDAEVRLSESAKAIEIPPGESRQTAVMITLRVAAFHGGRHDTTLLVSDGAGYRQSLPCRCLGPQNK